MSDHQPAAFGRGRYAVAACCVILLGFASRSKYADVVPAAVTIYAGDTLWALMVYLLMATLCPAAHPRRIAAAAVAFAFLIEFSQLFKPPWLEQIRNLPGMRLVLGYGFLWSDLWCYAAGILIGWQGDRFFRNASQRGLVS